MKFINLKKYSLADILEIYQQKNSGWNKFNIDDLDVDVYVNPKSIVCYHCEEDDREIHVEVNNGKKIETYYFREKHISHYYTENSFDGFEEYGFEYNENDYYNDTEALEKLLEGKEV